MDQFPGSKWHFCRCGGDPEFEVACEFYESLVVFFGIRSNLDQLLILELPPEDRQSEKPSWEEAGAFAAHIVAQCLRDTRRRRSPVLHLLATP